MKAEDVAIKDGFYDHSRDPMIILKESRGDDGAVTHPSVPRRRTHKVTEVEIRIVMRVVNGNSHNNYNNHEGRGALQGAR